MAKYYRKKRVIKNPKRIYPEIVGHFELTKILEVRLLLQHYCCLCEQVETYFYSRYDFKASQSYFTSQKDNPSHRRATLLKIVISVGEKMKAKI